MNFILKYFFFLISGPSSDYASLDITREMANSLDKAIIKPLPVVSRLRLDDDEDDDIDNNEPHEDDLEADLDLELTSTAPVTTSTTSNSLGGVPHSRAYSVG